VLGVSFFFLFGLLMKLRTRAFLKRTHTFPVRCCRFFSTFNLEVPGVVLFRLSYDGTCYELDLTRLDLIYGPAGYFIV
jgi:hypothetical protein